MVANPRPALAGFSDAFRSAIRDAWNSETSADPAKWHSDNPAWGQCAVTALLVQEELGGKLLRAEVNGVSHYWNWLPTGEEVDLTREQFGPRAVVPKGEVRSRDYVLSFPATHARYTTLRREVRSRLGS